MSKISGDLRLREWYAIKHALEFTIQNKESSEKDKEQEKKIIDQVVEIINGCRSQKTKEHYSIFKRLFQYDDSLIDGNYD